MLQYAGKKDLKCARETAEALMKTVHWTSKDLEILPSRQW